VVAESLELAEAKTRQAVALLAGLGLDGSQSVLVVIDRDEPALERALRNLHWARVLRVEGLNTYDVLRHPKLLLTRSAVDAIHARLGATARAAEAEA
jgi:large subunit ribosomal protein L4